MNKELHYIYKVEGRSQANLLQQSADLKFARPSKSRSVTAHMMARIIWLSALMLLWFQMGVSLSADGNTPSNENLPHVDFRNGRLKVSVQDQKFQKVMEEVARKAGIRIVLNEPADENLTASFDYLPLENGLQKLLRGRNYVFFYRSLEGSQHPKLTQVLVLPKREGETVASSELMAEKRSVDRAEQKQPVEELLNIDQEDLAEALQDLSQNSEEISKQFYEALEELQKMEGYVELRQFEEGDIAEVIQSGIEMFKSKPESNQAVE